MSATAKKPRTRHWKSTATAPEQIAAVRSHCDRVTPTLPGGSKCSYPKCWQPACRGEIEGGLREHARKAPADVEA